jgi:hypothetical protein
LRPPLGSLGLRPAGREAPQHHESRDRLDEAIRAEADQGDRRRCDSGTDRDRELDEVPGDPAPREKPRPADEAVALPADGDRHRTDLELCGHGQSVLRGETVAFPT